MCILDDDLSLPCKCITMNVTVKSLIEYDQVVSRFDEMGCISVNITNFNPSEWSAKSKISHSKFIKVLTISNVTSVDLLFDILSQTTFLRELEINGLSSFNCIFSENSILFKRKNFYSFLSIHEITNFSACLHDYFVLASLFSFHQLKTISVDKVIIDDTNINLVRLLMRNSAQTLNTIGLTG